MTLEDWLDDLCVRFIVNIPQEELQSVERICFQVEEAQWYYEDFVRPLDPALPSLSLRNFCLRIFQHCPLLSSFSQHHHSTAFSEFLAYKTRVPVRGAILLNDAMDHIVLVKGYKKSGNWGFPRGKINKDEKNLDCAIREVDEETGFDLREAGILKNQTRVAFIDKTLREQNIRLYVFGGVPMNTRFEPKTRKEISKIRWHRLTDLPTIRKSKQAQYRSQVHNDGEDDEGLTDLAENANRFYMVAPFLAPLRKWIAAQKKSGMAGTEVPEHLAADIGTEPLDVEQSSSVATAPVDSDAAVISTGVPLGGENQPPADMPAAPLVHPSGTTELDATRRLGGGPSAELMRLIRQKTDPPVSHQYQKESNAILALLRNGDGATKPREDENANPAEAPSRALQAKRDTGAGASHPVSSGLTPFPTSLFNPSFFVPGQTAPPHSATPNGSLPRLPANPPVPRQLSLQDLFGNNYQPPKTPEATGSTRVAQPPVARAGVPLVTAPLRSNGLPKPFSGARIGRDTVGPTSSLPHPSAHTVTAPAASQLPAPKLTSHSMTLLNMLKNEPAPKEPTGVHRLNPIAPNARAHIQSTNGMGAPSLSGYSGGGAGLEASADREFLLGYLQGMARGDRR
ncbi:MAG: mRNA-decapping enzyme subunit 2 [Phylliscum demangeonii]|nr:MAG: mRNA-decapping enzyme subunit 2 [Phylliscum demangeonii]